MIKFSKCFIIASVVFTTLAQKVLAVDFPIEKMVIRIGDHDYYQYKCIKTKKSAQENLTPINYQYVYINSNAQSKSDSWLEFREARTNLPPIHVRNKELTTKLITKLCRSYEEKSKGLGDYADKRYLSGKKSKKDEKRTSITGAEVYNEKNSPEFTGFSICFDEESDCKNEGGWLEKYPYHPKNRYYFSSDKISTFSRNDFGGSLESSKGLFHAVVDKNEGKQKARIYKKINQKDFLVDIQEIDFPVLSPATPSLEKQEIVPTDVSPVTPPSEKQEVGASVLSSPAISPPVTTATREGIGENATDAQKTASNGENNESPFNQPINSEEQNRVSQLLKTIEKKTGLPEWGVIFILISVLFIIILLVWFIFKRVIPFFSSFSKKNKHAEQSNHDKPENHINTKEKAQVLEAFKEADWDIRISPS